MDHGEWEIGRDVERSRCVLNEATHPEFNWNEEESERNISTIVGTMAKLLVELIRNELKCEGVNSVDAIQASL
jgi:hypothetical protein